MTVDALSLRFAANRGAFDLKNPNVEALRDLEAAGYGYYNNGPSLSEQAVKAQESPKGVKYDGDKPKWSLLPNGVVAAVVRVLTFGARKYAPDNWKHVERSRYYDALWRHVDAWRDGQTLDPETNEHHLAHAICCLMFMLWLDINNPPLPRVKAKSNT